MSAHPKSEDALAVLNEAASWLPYDGDDNAIRSRYAEVKQAIAELINAAGALDRFEILPESDDEYSFARENLRGALSRTGFINPLDGPRAGVSESSVGADEDRFARGLGDNSQAITGANDHGVGAESSTNSDGIAHGDEALVDEAPFVAVHDAEDTSHVSLRAANQDLLAVLKRIIKADDDAKAAAGNPDANLNGVGLVDLFDIVGHPFGSGKHKQQPCCSVQLSVALTDARALLAKAVRP